MTSLTGEFETDLPLEEATVACADAIDGLGFRIEAVEPNRIVSYAGSGAVEYPPKIEVVLTESGQGTDVRIIGTDTEANQLKTNELAEELDRVRDAIQASVQDASATSEQGPPAGWYPDPSDTSRRRYWGGRGWTDRTEAASGDLPAPPDPATRQGGGPEGSAAPPREATGRTENGRARTRTAVFVSAVVLLAAGLGVGGYFLGRSTGENLDAARAAGAAAGQNRGAAKGAAQGYAVGLKAGRKAGYGQTYPTAYRKAYRKAFEDAGLSAPTKVSLPK